MRRLVVLFLFLFLLFLVGFSLFSKYILNNKSNPLTQMIIPAKQEEVLNKSESSVYVPLNDNETLVSSLTMDIDGDGYEDQIQAIKLNDSPFLNIYFLLYNPILTNYERVKTIKTDISQIQSFSCYSLDVLGKNSNSFIYQGTSDKGNSILKIINGHRESNGEFVLSEIGDFNVKGTVFIQQDSMANDYDDPEKAAVTKSLPVWVYSSEESEGQFYQVQSMYDWNSQEGKYVQVSVTRNVDSSPNQKSIALILDGKVSTFEKYLDGLWGKIDNDKVVRYIYFDYPDSEIIFQEDKTEELYYWNKSSLKRSGIYFTATNKTVSNLRRNFDISLVNSEEIRISVRDDVRMNIATSNTWNGRYKKIVLQSDSKDKTEVKGKDCFDELALSENGWKTEDGTLITFKDNKYTAEMDSSRESGRYAKIILEGKTFVQMRPEGESALADSFSGVYIPSFVDESDPEKKNLSLQKVILNPDGYIPDKNEPVLLTKVIIPDESELEEEDEVSVAAKKNGPKLSVKASPKYFSPDNDGKDETVTIYLSAESKKPIKDWSFTIINPNTGKAFWSTSGKSQLKNQIVWDGKGSNGSLVQSATDYPYEFTVADSDGGENTLSGQIHVDVLLMREAGKLKMQIPSIIFRSDNADFKSQAEVAAGPEEERDSKGLDQKTIDNNIRVLKRIADILKKFPDYKVTIEGNANNLTGSSQEEREVQILSEQRAKFVRDWLIRNGIPANRLYAVGNGSKNPVAWGDDLDSRRRNRRVDFILNK